MIWKRKKIPRQDLVLVKYWEGGRPSSWKERFSRQKEALGLDFGGSALKFVTLRLVDNKLKLVRWGLYEIESPESEQARQNNREQLLSWWVNRFSLKGKRVITAVAGDSVNIRYLILPDMPDEEFVKSARLEMAAQFFFNEQQTLTFAYPYRIVKEENGVPQKMGLALAVKQEFFKSKINLLKSIGLKIKGIKLDSFALLDALIDNHRTSEDTVALVDLGTNSVQIVIAEGNEIDFTRDLCSMDSYLINEIAEVYNIDRKLAEKVKRKIRLTVDKEGNEELFRNKGGALQHLVYPILSTLVDEIKISLQYYHSKGKGELKKIFLSGGGALMEGFDGFLSQNLGFPVEVGDPLQDIEIDDETLNLQDLKKLSPRLAIALGLAKGALRESKASQIDLLKLKDHRTLPKGLVVGSMMLVILFILGFHFYLENLLSSYQRRIEEKKTILQEIEQFKEQTQWRQTMERNSQTIRSLQRQQSHWSVVLRELSNIIPENVWLEELTGKRITSRDAGEATLLTKSEPGETVSDSSKTDLPEKDSQQLYIRGKANQQHFIRTFVSQLEKSQSLKDIQLTKIESKQEDLSKSVFEIKGRVLGNSENK